jgi:CRISPR-associated endonuclease Cas2
MSRAPLHTLLAYDIVKNKARNRLFKRLHAFLTPVQKSVFEGPLPDRRLPQLVGLVERCIDPETDRVRIVQLCPACARSMQVFGVSLPPVEEDLVRFF